MYPISAADAISPAIQRTRTFLFRPFRLGTYLKLCVVALLTEGLGGSGNFNTGHHYTNHKTTVESFAPFAFTPERIAEAVFAFLLVMLLCFWIYYLITRLRFAFFHCLIHNIKEIRPGWHIYREPATRFFWLNFVVGLCFLLLVALIAIPFAAGFLGLFHNIAAGGHPDLGSILALVLPLIPIILVLVLLGIAVDVVLRDLMLPHYALEDATAGQAWSAVWARISAAKGSFLGYAVLRVLLPIVAMIGLFIVLILPAIIFAVVVVGIEVVLHAAFSGASGGAALVGIFLQVLVGVIAAALALLAWIVIGGPLSTAIRQYALIFYGSRYPALGNILFPPPPVAQPAPGTA
ncbi:MAG: hypothetical protein WBP95_20175 [Acidobacteriaceae bacterium]